MKFRDVLQKALDNKTVTLDSSIEYKYEEIKVYRGITRPDKVRTDLNEMIFFLKWKNLKKPEE